MYLDSLNERQLEAVRTTEGPVRVIAGAGTGKTRALTARYCYITDLLGVDPSAVLCVTFTNKAAAEMKERIRRALGDFDLSGICTFHSWCVRMLKEDIHVLGYPACFVVADEDDQTELLLKVYSDLGLTLKDLPVKRAIDYISQRKSASDAYIRDILNPDHLDLVSRSERDADRLDTIFLRYLYEQKKNYAVDFDDIIILARYILATYPDILAKWQARMQYVMVDEFQDVSPRQYEIARMLAASHRNLFIVGDPDQTIYSWRGADVRLFLDFDKVYPDAVTIVMDSNYRSTPQIIAPSNALIAHNANRYPKSLHATLDSGSRPILYHARNERDEARWMARRIAELHDAGWQLSDVAILYRAHHVSRPIEDALIKASIPYRIYSGTAFYARREVKDMICYMRMLTVGDDMSFRRTVNNPPRKIGKKKLAALEAEAEATGDRLIDALRRMASTPAFAGTGARDYLDTIDSAAAMAATASLGDLLQHLLARSGYEEMLRNLSEWERLDNLAELKRAVEEAGHDDDATLDDFLARAALMSNIDRENESATDAVRMMTVHTAKGMEFPVVFLCSMSEGSMPSRRSSSPDEIEEERRLAYVAVTRARHALFISDSEGYGHDNTARQPSRFIYELDLKNIDQERPVPPRPVIAVPMAGAGSGADFASGDVVEHPVFGRGMVMEVDTARRTYTLQFDKIPTPRTLRFGAPLSAIDPTAQ